MSLNSPISGNKSAKLQTEWDQLNTWECNALRFFERIRDLVMDYFKHYVTASDGNTLNQIEDRFGHAGYAYWMKLLELCVQNWDGKSEPTFNFFETIVRRKLKISSTKLQLFLRFCEEISALSVELSEKNIQISIPNLKEIKESRGRIYGNKNLKTDILKNKNKEEDKDKEKENNDSNSSVKKHPGLPDGITPDRIIQAFNDTLAKKAGKIDFCIGLSAKSIHELVTTLSFKEFHDWKTWEDLFRRVSESPFLCGEQASFVATLDWLVDHNNALKVLSGKYPPALTPQNKFASLELE